KTLNDAERKWVTAEKEAYAIVWALKHWGCYLRGRQVTVITDHKNLQWMFEKSNGKLHRWSMLLSEFYLTIKHRSGQFMCHVDCLVTLMRTLLKTAWFYQFHTMKST